MNFLAQTHNFIIAIDWSSFLIFLRRLCIFLNIVAVISFIVLFSKAIKLRPSFRFKKIQKKGWWINNSKIVKKWHSILIRSETNPPQSMILAIIEADKFIDDLLKKMKIPGEGMAERLKKLSFKGIDKKVIDNLWRVHKIRNNLVHTPDFKIDSADVRRVLETYENFLKEIKIFKK